MSIRIRIIFNGEERIHEMRDHETVVVVGRKNKCDIALEEEPRASRQHFRIEKEGDGYVLLDLDSSNGTQLNGKDVKRARLQLGDKIAVGSTVLYFGEPAPVKKVPSRRPSSTGRPASAVGRPASAVASGMSAERRAELEAMRMAGGQSHFIKNLFIAATALLVLGIGGMVMWKAMNPPKTGGEDIAEQPDSQGDLNNNLAAAEKDRVLQEFYQVQGADMDVDEQIEKISALYDKYVTAPFADELKTIRDSVLESVGKKVQRKLEHLMQEGTEYARRQYRYGDVLQALSDFANRYSHEKYQSEKWLPTYEAERRRLIADAESFFEGTLVYEANDLIRSDRFDDAVSLYENAKRENFKGFRKMATRCDDRISLVRAVVEARSRGVDQGEAVQRMERATETTRQRIRREDADAPSGSTGGSATPQPDPESMVDRGAEQKMLDALHQKFLNACNGRDGEKLKSGTIQYRGDEAPVADADDKGIGIYRQGIRILVKWDRVKPEMQFSGYNDIAGLTLDDKWAIAIYAHRHGMLEEAEGILYEVWEEDNSRKEQIDYFIARIKSKPVPAGGFIPWKLKGQSGVFITPNEKEEWEVARKIDELVDTIDDNIDSSSGRSKERVQEAVVELSKYGEEARRRGVQIIEEKKQKLMDSISKKGFGSNGQLDVLKTKLDEARKDALRIIYDKSIYPDENHGAVGQPTVDEAVDKVKEIWNNPASEVAIPGNIQKDVDAVRDLIDIAKQIDPDGQVTDNNAEKTFLDWVRSLANKKLNIQNYSKNGTERAMYAEAEQIEKDNNEGDSVATAEERQHVSILNAYRVMMGRHALRINPKLTTSARRHSEYLKSSGQFAHVVPGHPDGETPSQRAQKQGYSGGGAENIAMAGRGHSPMSAFTAWYNSSGHHRNMLNDRHRVIGAGSAGSHWTQQFGPREDGSEPKAGN